jgi:ATP/maltotriose-dependent transcriptional regulator MalT
LQGLLFAQKDNEDYRKQREAMVRTQIATLRWSGSQAVWDSRVLDSASELTIAVREVLNGRSYLTPAIAREMVEVLSRRDKKFIDEEQRLTERQREVLQLLTEGKSMKQVAHTLHITANTVASTSTESRKVLVQIWYRTGDAPNTGSRAATTRSTLR